MSDNLSSCARPGDFLAELPTSEYHNKRKLIQVTNQVAELEAKVAEMEKFIAHLKRVRCYV